MMKTSDTTVISRTPVVVVMGHIDHGKTTLLDTIRKTNVVAKEAGGITQHIGAYEIEYKGKKLTFIDTPGHEAFGKMRMRGAHVADIAVLVVAADDGIKPQTLDALGAIREANIPFIIAINKIDKPNANIPAVKSALGEVEVLIEEWGGKVPAIEISAKAGTNVDELIEMILLVAELEDLSYDPSKPAEGVVIESHRDMRRGNSGTLLLTDGVLRTGMWVAAGKSSTRVKLMENHIGEPISEATASMPIRLIGFDVVPDVGLAVKAFHEKKELEVYIDERDVTNRKNMTDHIVDGKSTISIYMKADVAGSLEALEEQIKKLEFPHTQLKFVGGGVGDISESDVKAVATDRKDIDAMIIGFNVKSSLDAESAAERFGVRIGTEKIIYEAIRWVDATARNITPKSVIRKEQGSAEILKIFARDKSGIVIGGRVDDGAIGLGFKFEVEHRGRVVAKGVVKNLQQNKKDVDRVEQNNLFGASVSYVKDLDKGDVLKLFIEEELVA